MPRRGLSELEPVTFARGAVTIEMRSPDGDPLNGAWANFHAVDRHPGVMEVSPTGRAGTVFMPHEAAGGGLDLELRFDRYSFDLYDALEALFADDSPIDVRIPVANGRVWAGRVRPDRREGTIPLSAPGDHPQYGGQGRDLTLKLITANGGWEDPE